MPLNTVVLGSNLARICRKEAISWKTAEKCVFTSFTSFPGNDAFLPKCLKTSNYGIRVPLYWQGLIYTGPDPHIYWSRTLIWAPLLTTLGTPHPCTAWLHVRQHAQREAGRNWPWGSDMSHSRDTFRPCSTEANASKAN